MKRKSIRLALSVYPIYADRIVRGEKRWEYRNRPTKVRGTVYVYATKRFTLRDGYVLPNGVIVGTVDIVDCTGGFGDYEWHLSNPVRFRKPIKPKGHPQPVWFRPFPDKDAGE